MSQSNQPPQAPYGQTNVYITPQPSNGLGVAGFVTSLVGIVTCGILSPIGLILSFFAMFKRPRGFAVAGVVIGLFGTIVMVFWGLMFVLSAIGIGKGIQTAADAFQTRDGAVRAAALIEKSKQETGSLPSDSEGMRLIAGQLDAWDNGYRYKKTGEDSYLITSSGRDGEFDTEDDAEFDQSEITSDPFRLNPTTAPFNLPDNPPEDIPTH